MLFLQIAQHELFTSAILWLNDYVAGHLNNIQVAAALLEKKIIRNSDMTKMKKLMEKEEEVQANQYLIRRVMKPEALNIFMMSALFQQDEKLFDIIMNAVEKTETGKIPLLVSTLMICVLFKIMIFQG